MIWLVFFTDCANILVRDATSCFCTLNPEYSLIWRNRRDAVLVTTDCSLANCELQTFYNFRGVFIGRGGGGGGGEPHNGVLVK